MKRRQQGTHPRWRFGLLWLQFAVPPDHHQNTATPTFPLPADERLYERAAEEGRKVPFTLCVKRLITRSVMDTIEDIYRGRTQRYHVKLFEAETNFDANLRLNASSIQYGSGPVSKLEYAKYMFASPASLIVGQRDSAGVGVGRLKERNWRAAHPFDLTIQRLEPPRGKQLLEVTWQRNARHAEWSQMCPRAATCCAAT